MDWIPDLCQEIELDPYLHEFLFNSNNNNNNNKDHAEQSRCPSNETLDNSVGSPEQQNSGFNKLKKNVQN